MVENWGRVHVIAGANASYHAVFDPPGQAENFVFHEKTEAPSRFGATINRSGQIIVIGGLTHLVWYVLNPSNNYQPIAWDALLIRPSAATTSQFLTVHWCIPFAATIISCRGKQYAYQRITWPYPETGTVETLDTPRGIYPALRTYLYQCHDFSANPPKWQAQVISDVSDSHLDGARGTTEQQDLMMDIEGAST